MKKRKLVVAVAGADGDIGRHLLKQLQDKIHIIGLSPRGNERTDTDHLTWRSCDLFSLADAEKGLEGVDIAVYLAHSRSSTAKLTQGSFADLEVILADNFAQAAKQQNVKEVLYLGGFMPEKRRVLARHVDSLLEVERILRSYGTPVTAFRAGAIDRTKKSSLLTTLAKRLFMTFLSKGRRTKTQPIALTDVVNSLASFIVDKGKASHAIHTRDQEFTANPPQIQEKNVVGLNRASKNKVIKRTLSCQQEGVRSVQRVKLPQGATADWVGRHYMKWLEHMLTPLISTSTSESFNHEMSLFGKLTLLELIYSESRSTPDRALYYITGGILLNHQKNERGRMEFRKIPGTNEVIIGIHDFVPVLPWLLYYSTQANIHLIVMYLFQKHMAKISQHGIKPEILYDGTTGFLE